MPDLRILRIRNFPESRHISSGYSDVGEELIMDTILSDYMKKAGNIDSWHRLEGYLHGVAGTQGKGGGFKQVVKRDLALVNKVGAVLMDNYRVPANWWCQNKGMVQLKDGSWTLGDHEMNDAHEDEDDDHHSRWMK